MNWLRRSQHATRATLRKLLPINLPHQSSHRQCEWWLTGRKVTSKRSVPRCRPGANAHQRICYQKSLFLLQKNNSSDLSNRLDFSTSSASVLKNWDQVKIPGSCFPSTSKRVSKVIKTTSSSTDVLWLFIFSSTEPPSEWVMFIS